MTIFQMCFRCLCFFIVLSAAARVGAAPFQWRSEGTFDASTEPQSAFNTFNGISFGGVNLVDVDFSHTISVLDGGVLQLNEGEFTINASNGDELVGVYSDFRYTPNPAPAEDFTGVGEFTFIGGTGMFDGAMGEGTWLAEASFFVGSDSMGVANHNWTGELTLVPEPSSPTILGLFGFGLLVRRRLCRGLE